MSFGYSNQSDIGKPDSLISEVTKFLLFNVITIWYQLYTTMAACYQLWVWPMKIPILFNAHYINFQFNDVMGCGNSFIALNTAYIVYSLVRLLYYWGTAHCGSM